MRRVRDVIRAKSVGIDILLYLLCLDGSVIGWIEYRRELLLLRCLFETENTLILELSLPDLRLQIVVSIINFIIILLRTPY